MNRRDERILHRAEKAGVKLAKKQGHIPTREDLLELKIQVIPNALRWLCFGGSVICGITAWFLNTLGNTVAASSLAVLSLFLLIFSIFGIRRKGFSTAKDRRRKANPTGNVNRIGIPSPRTYLP